MMITWLCFSGEDCFCVYREVAFFIEDSLRRAAIDDGDGLRFRWRLKDGFHDAEW
ncbi:unnamed protein product [Arabidopsis lyrata]|uniref:Predicted protein n=1 Tax=Arabidopsis lyrata subsp. lyrata TaxID=81972 RepID=D7MA13_ARALL|nr:predicted protein [Arabidopsis lyrata subsp. lyrata]CAH8273976.1 unnamed protein product [Arabidopsis lyrata]